MRTIAPTEYNLSLSTGEQITIAELDPVHVPELAHPAALAGCASLLAKVSHIEREFLEEAKLGYDANFLRRLRSAPHLCLVQVANPSCALNDLRECVMASPICHTKQIKGKLGIFPECFTYLPEIEEDPEEHARSLGTAIVLAWRKGYYAVVVK